MRKKTSFGTAMVVEKYWHPPLLRVSWALVILMKSCVDANVCGCGVRRVVYVGKSFQWAMGGGYGLYFGGAWSFCLEGHVPRAVVQNPDFRPSRSPSLLRREGPKLSSPHCLSTGAHGGTVVYYRSTRAILEPSRDGEYMVMRLRGYSKYNKGYNIKGYSKYCEIPKRVVLPVR